jgi:hypothetical protein
LLDKNGVTFTIPDEINKSNTAAADVTWRIRPGEKFDVGAAGLYRRFSGVYMEQRSFTLNTNDCSLSSPTVVVTGQEGQAIGGSLLLTYNPSSLVTGRLYFRHLEMFSGDEPLVQEWQTAPERKFVTQISLRPYADLSAWIRMTHRSSTAWQAYQQVTTLTCTGGGYSARYSPDTGGSTKLDINIRKLLLKRKLSADLICRNLWNADDRYHPAGASFDLSFYLLLGFEHRSD